MIRLPEVLTAGGTAVIEFQLIDEKTGQVSDVELAGATVIASIRKNSTPRTEPELPRRDAHADLDTKVVTLTLNEAETAALGGDPDSPVPLTTFSTMDVLVQSPSSDYYFGPYEFGVRLPETSTTLPGPIPDPTPVPLPQSANRAYWLVDVPLATLGIDGDVALVRVSSLVVRAYTKVAGVWVRDWNFSGGDSVLLASGAVIPDRHPAADPDGTGFIRFIGISGYAPVTDADVDHADPSANMVTRLDQMRGGNRGTSTLGRSSTLPSPSSFGYTIEVYLWFGIEKSAALGLMIAGVSRGSVNIPIVAQGDVVRSGTEILAYRTVGTYTQAEVDADAYVLDIRKDPAAPSTWNRYAVVTQNQEPTAPDFLNATARTSESIRVLIPNTGWGDDRRAYLHFALPIAQDAPTIAGQVGGINLIDDFVVRSTANKITINGDDMRTLSSDAPVFQMTDQFSLFPWLVR